MNQHSNCNICNIGSFSEATDLATVHSNVRKWKNEKFTVWRCSYCNSIHSLEAVDLDKYYATYPFKARSLDNWTRRVYKNYTKKLKKLGLTNQNTVIDYGCSEGLFLDFLKEEGIDKSTGYDAYIERFSDTSVLKNANFDFVVAQDLIEHTEDTKQLFSELVDLVKPGGFLIIGTPNAEAINLKQPDRFIHSLHQPYHIHILSKSALLNIAREQNLKIIEKYERHITDTLYPFTNWTFLHAYLAKQDNTLDAGFEKPNITTIMTSPSLIFKGIFGYFFPIKSEIIAIFQKPKNQNT